MRPIAETLLPALALAAAISSAHAASAPGPGNDFDDPNAIRVLLTARMETTLSSQMNGTLSELRGVLGQRVARNAVLAELNCDEVWARAKVAKAEVSMARQNLDAKHSLRKLNAAGDLEVAMAATDLERAEGSAALVSAQSGYCRVLAPFSGKVAKVHVKPFQTVAAGTPMFDLVSDGPLKVRLNVPSTQLRKLKVGTALEVSIHETGKTYPARVSAINARVDAVAQTVELEARLNAEHSELIAGMSGVARFPPGP